jgi:uncharacterized membrane protein YphA (DoxX/SURF4 family)
MSFSQSAASHLVPLIARIVLAAAFIPAGYNKLMREESFAGDDAKRLRELQVVAAAPDRGFAIPASLTAAVLTVEAVHAATAGPHAVLASTSVEPAPAPQAQQPAEAAPGPQTPAPQGNAATPSTPPPQAAQPEIAPGEPIKARALHKVTLMVDKAGWPYPVWLGRIAALTEFVGGICLVLGLLSRVWGLGLAIAMAVAFWLTTWPVLTGTSMFQLSIPDYNRFVAQIALFALAFGIVLTGAGAASLDKRIFGSGGDGGGAKKPADG